MDDEMLPAVIEPASAPTLWHSDDPSEIVAKATSVANTLSKVIAAKGLFVNIQGRKHVRVEGWCLLGTLLGVVPVVVWTKRLEDGWEARVEARTFGGAVVGAAECSCTRDETMWSKRDDYALRSMAQTRATAKALRGPLGFVVSLAGYDATPADEMPHVQPQARAIPARERGPARSARPDTPAPVEPQAHPPVDVLVHENEDDALRAAIVDALSHHPSEKRDTIVALATKGKHKTPDDLLSSALRPELEGALQRIGEMLRKKGAA